MIVGPSGSGKSTLWRILKGALIKMKQEVKQYTMNPKAMPRTQVSLILSIRKSDKSLLMTLTLTICLQLWQRPDRLKRLLLITGRLLLNEIIFGCFLLKIHVRLLPH